MVYTTYVFRSARNIGLGNEHILRNSQVLGTFVARSFVLRNMQ